MLHLSERAVEILVKCRKLPRLVIMALVLLMVGSALPLPYAYAFVLQAFGVLFGFLAWIEGISLSIRALDLIGERGKSYNVIRDLYDMEFDPPCLKERRDQK